MPAVVFIISSDRTFRTSIRAELRERGVEALGLETLDEAGQLIAAGRHPTAAVLDVEGRAGDTDVANQLGRHVPIIAVATRSYPPRLPSATVLLHRPVRVADIVERVLEVLKGRPA